MSSADQPSASSQINVIELTEAVARQIVASDRTARFSDTFGDTAPLGSLIGSGDMLEISLWEAPPAVLFGATASGILARNSSTSQNVSLPGQVVDENGLISVPFAGSVRAAGQTPSQIEKEIVRRLRGKAHLPQATVRLVRNQAANVSVVGDVTTNGRIPLTPKGERLLDVLASAGGVKHPVNKIMVQLTRNNQVAAMPLATVIQSPQQNVVLQPNDVITLFYQPFSFTAFGATGNNSELPFEATGITLSQALGRVGGLRDDRADARGIFLFRLEDPAKLGTLLPANPRLTPDGRLPVVYRLNLKDPGSFFVAQGFPMRNQDVLYVSNAPMADLQKFVNIVSSLTFSVIGVKSAVNPGL